MLSLGSFTLNRYYVPSLEHVSSYMTTLLLLFLASRAADAKITLEKLNTLYLSKRPTATGSNAYTFPSNALEFSAYDSEYHVIYTVGQQYLRAIDASNPRRLDVLTYVEEIGSKFSSVHVCGQFVVATLPNKDQPHQGRVIVYQKLTPQFRDLTQLHSITVGSKPDHLAITKDCRTMVVALEGSAYVVQQSRELIDPEGGVGIIHFPNGANSLNVPSNSPLYTYNRLNFTKFNARTEELINRGVRFIYRIQNNTLSRDLEPEYVTLSEDDTTAYVSLQENNALAVVNMSDITAPDITSIVPLGYKNWNASAMDPSDRDGLRNLKPHPIYGMFQPDGIAHKTIAGVPYIFTANEGDQKQYPDIRWTEVKRGRQFLQDGMITREASNLFVSELENDALLGRLEFTMDDGAFIYTGEYKELYTFGARSFSIFRADDMSLMYDSGDHIERSHATYYPELFNADSKRYMNSIETTADLRSDNKGPECESITLAELNNKILIFVGNERPGTVSVYSITDNNVLAPEFESLNYGGELVPGQTWQQAYQSRTIGDIDPESIVFVPATENPTGEPIVIVTGAVSGTISIYTVKDDTLNDVVISTEVVPPSPPDALSVLTPNTETSAVGNNVSSAENQTRIKMIEERPTVESALTPTVTHEKPAAENINNNDARLSETPAPVRELNCPIYSIKCRNYRKCVPRQLRCDGIDDCGDSTDEVNCGNHAIEQILMLCVATVTLGAISIVIALLSCCFLKKRSIKYEKYEMKTRV